ncbi:MAG: winged helix-turn-helix transcriptional regulator [Syntrophaceae bacterium]|nr:winged helix-turn-helix transcriptional regulator [Syntrophaceae bacterium]
MLEKVGGSATQIAALFYLLENDGCLLVDLSRELLQQKSAITTLVERMEKNRLLRKVPSPTDKRASQLYLTNKGKEMGQMALPFITVYNTELSADFNEKELSVIVRFLDCVISRFETLPENYFKKMVQSVVDK